MLNLWILNTKPRSGEGLLRSGNDSTTNLLLYNPYYRITEPSAQFNPKCDYRLLEGGVQWACLISLFGMV